MALKVSLGSQLLTETFKDRGAKAELARRIKSRQELVARWATGARIPSEEDQSWMEDNANIPARSWGDPPLPPKLFWDWVREHDWEAVQLVSKEASSETTPAFPADDSAANGGTGHAA